MKYKKVFEAYKKKADSVMNFQLCRAYFGDNCSMLGAVEKILSERFGGLTGKERLIIRDSRGKGFIELPDKDFKGKSGDVLAEYVERRFDTLVREQQSGKPNYPLTFRDIVERNLE